MKKRLPKLFQKQYRINHDGRLGYDDLLSLGLQPAWSKTFNVNLAEGVDVQWHALDSGTPAEKGTIVCVHGNPTWSYVWRQLVERPPEGWRVVAVDQTNMGFSERHETRRLAQRSFELAAFCQQNTSGPVILVAHDWGGPTATGALHLLDDVKALILCNTAMRLPEGMKVPPLIRTAKSKAKFFCATTPTFIRGTAQMTNPEHRDAINAPYLTSGRRQGIFEYVDDIPTDPNDISWGALQKSADNLKAFPGPTLYLWGTGDPVFHEGFLSDMIALKPSADVHVIENAGHLVSLHQQFGGVVNRWVSTVLDRKTINETAPTTKDYKFKDGNFTAVTSGLEKCSEMTEVIYHGPGGKITGKTLTEQVNQIAKNLVSTGVQPGDRIALLVPPSPMLLAAAYGAWLAGATIVVAEPHLGIKQMKTLLRSATPKYAIVDNKTEKVAKLIRMLPNAQILNVNKLNTKNLMEINFPELTPNMPAAIVHTSGATGPAKPVLYTHEALAKQRNAVKTHFVKGSYTTSFAPFALLAPALATACHLPEDPRPNRFAFPELSTASQTGVVTAWLSPQAAKNIIETAEHEMAPMEIIMLAGAPIPITTVQKIREITGADVRCPYGMTEALPLTDGTNPELQGPHSGLCTGKPLPEVTIRTIDIETLESTDEPGELVISCPWMYQTYDRRWGTSDAHTIHIEGERFHRTGDYGYIHDGYIFQLGRTSHIIYNKSQPTGCVAVEQEIQPLFDTPVAAVGVGPHNNQQIVVVIGKEQHLTPASFEETQKIRTATSHNIVAVLSGRLPTDKRHATKIDRTKLAKQASQLLEGK